MLCEVVFLIIDMQRLNLFWGERLVDNSMNRTKENKKTNHQCQHNSNQTPQRLSYLKHFFFSSMCSRLSSYSHFFDLVVVVVVIVLLSCSLINVRRNEKVNIQSFRCSLNKLKISCFSSSTFNLIWILSSCRLHTKFKRVRDCSFSPSPSPSSPSPLIIIIAMNSEHLFIHQLECLLSFVLVCIGA